jgi:hypothetical protein
MRVEPHDNDTLLASLAHRDGQARFLASMIVPYPTINQEWSKEFNGQQIFDRM